MASNLAQHAQSTALYSSTVPQWHREQVQIILSPSTHQSAHKQISTFISDIGLSLITGVDLQQQVKLKMAGLILENISYSISQFHLVPQLGIFLRFNINSYSFKAPIIIRPTEDGLLKYNGAIQCRRSLLQRVLHSPHSPTTSMESHSYHSKLPH